MKKIILFLVIMVTISGCFNNNEDLNEREKSQNIAEEYVKNTYEFDHYNGINLNVTQISVQECSSCWTFTFEFDVNTEEPSEIKSFKITVPVNQGIVKDAVVKNITVGEAEKPQDTMFVFDLLKNPVYNKEIKVYGRVSNLDESSDSSFDLIAGEEKIIVVYDSASKDSDTPSPANIEDINNGDWIVVTGELILNAGDTSSNNFLAKNMELYKSGKSKQLNPATLYCINQGGKAISVDGPNGLVDYCILSDNKATTSVCQQARFYDTGECILLDDAIEFSSAKECQSVCEDMGFEGQCLSIAESEPNGINIGKCMIVSSENYGDTQQGDCICTPLDGLEGNTEELNEKCEDNCVNGICRNILCLKRESSCAGTLESCPREWIVKIANTKYYMTILE